MSFFKVEDMINGAEGEAYATIRGEVHNLFFLKNLEATAEKSKTDHKVLGKRGTQYRANGWEGSGSMTIYYATSMFRKLMIEYIKTGRDVYFDIMIVNNDPQSSLGKQTVVLKNCNLDSVLLAKIDVESEVLEEDMDFTFDDVELLDEFGAPINF